jgi:hypothetical protein
MEWINSVKPAVDARIVNNLSNDGNSVIDNCQQARNESRLAFGALLKVLEHLCDNNNNKAI